MNTIQTSFSGSPGQKLLLGSSLAQSQPPAEVMTPRLKGRDLYGGPVTFGSSARKTRLLSAGPYTAAFRFVKFGFKFDFILQATSNAYHNNISSGTEQQTNRRGWSE